MMIRDDKGYSYLSSLKNKQKRDWDITNHKEDMNQESNSLPCDIELSAKALAIIDSKKIPGTLVPCLSPKMSYWATQLRLLQPFLIQISLAPENLHQTRPEPIHFVL